MIGSILDGRTNSSSKASGNSPGTIAVYAVFVTVAVLVYHWIAEGEFSAVLTLSAIFQCLAFCLLGVQALAGTTQGISVKSLQLDALALACRLSSTTWLQGYLPFDSTGDYLYQCFDALSLAMVLWLLYRVLSIQKETYENDEDGLPAWPFAVASLVLAGLFHGDLNDRPLFDTLWMCGLFVSAVAVLPQLWMMTRSRASIPALTSHFVAVMAFSRILSGSYMWYAHSEITCKPWIGNFQHAGYAILAAHAVHLLLLGDFAYFYCKNLATSGLSAPLELSEAWVV
jgi:ER lumen protein retaining receptor